MNVPADRSPVEPVPLERNRALGLLAGLAMFATGFAVAGGLVALGGGAPAAYYVSVTVGLAGVGVVGFFLNRGTVPLPRQPIWSPTGISALCRAIGLPARVMMGVLYALGAAGVLGNLVIPLLIRGT